MALTQEQINDIVGKINGIKTVIDNYDRTEIEQVSDALGSDRHLAGSGSDTSDGDTYILVVKGSKV